MNPTAKQQLKDYATILCAGDSSFGEQRQALRDMHSLFVSLGAMDVDETVTENDPVWLSNGCAISPIAAGRCLFEMARTREFAAGIRKAIDQLLASDIQRPIHVLEAGCGPFGLLSLLAAVHTEQGGVVFHLLDIHQQNLDSAATLIRNLGMESSFGNFIKADAATYRWPAGTPLHALIIEVMLNALRKEPQVAVTLNLLPQLAEGGVLIPRRITVDLIKANVPLRAKMQELTRENGTVARSAGEERMARLIDLSKNSSPRDIAETEIADVIVEEFDPYACEFELHTTIEVFTGHFLQRNDTSLTFPIPILRKEKFGFGPGTTLSFRYEMNNNPGIRVSVKESMPVH